VVKYLEKLLNEENAWDKDAACEKIQEPCELLRYDEILKQLRTMNNGYSSYDLHELSQHWRGIVHRLL